MSNGKDPIKTSLYWKAAFILFGLFFIIEALLLYPVYHSYQDKLLNTLESDNKTIVKTLLVSEGDSINNDHLTQAFNKLQSQTDLKGLRVESNDVTVFHAGETPHETMNHLPTLARWLTESRAENGNRYDVYWDSQELQLPYDVTARLDSSRIEHLINLFLLKSLFYMILLALIIAGFAVLIFKKIASKEMTQEISNLQKTIKAHEAIMSLRIQERQKEAAQLANYDLVTELPNRNLLMEILGQQLDKVKQYNHQIALLAFELTTFHVITNAFGHNIGNEYLKGLTRYISQNMPGKCNLAALTTTRYAISLGTIHDISQVTDLANWLLDLIAKPIRVAQQNLVSAVNIGIAIGPNDGDTAESLITNANLALNRAKEKDPNSYQFYEAGMNTTIEARESLMMDLHDALKKNELVLYLQPQVDLSNFEIIGFEALIRWMHPKKGLIPPNDFIPLAESSGLIVNIGEWEIKYICKLLKDWQKEGLPKLVGAVNLSSIQFRAKNIVDIVSRNLIEADLEPKYLELEITESSVMSSLQESIAKMRALKALGISLSLDDFGTGYSSLSYLKRFPIDKIKIDQSFVRELDPDKQKLDPITDVIIYLGDSLGFRTIAEGIETKAQANYLKMKGCNEGQGYFFSKPIPQEEFKKMVLSGRHPGDSST